jgi:hypothetical protein
MTWHHRICWYLAVLIIVLCYLAIYFCPDITEEYCSPPDPAAVAYTHQTQQHYAQHPCVRK